MRRLPGAWTDTLAKLGFRRKRRKAGRRQEYHRRRPQLESLEPRQMLSATHLVTTTLNTLDNDYIQLGSGDGELSLREAIAAAEDTDTIEFDDSLYSSAPATIHLSGDGGPTGQLAVSDDITIAGPGADLLTIDAEGNSRVFSVTSGTEATISSLTVTGGGGATKGGGFYVAGDLSLDGVCIDDNAATDWGGGIYVYFTGTLELIDCTVDNNQASSGGGIFGHFKAGDSLQMTGTTISNNTSTGNGGGLTFFEWDSAAALGTIINCTFSERVLKLPD